MNRLGDLNVNGLTLIGEFRDMSEHLGVDSDCVTWLNMSAHRSSFAALSSRAVFDMSFAG
jgi:hypothetical protein